MHKKKVQMEFNSQIKGIFEIHNIPLTEGLSILLDLYYGLTPSYVPQDLKRKVLSCGILNYSYGTSTVEWNTPLFEEQVTGFEWITEYMNLFRDVNASRRGVKKDCLVRMKRFFVNNPAVRVEDVMRATRQYLKTLNNPTYCKMSHKFIYEQDGTSMLASYLETSKAEQIRTFDERM